MFYCPIRALIERGVRDGGARVRMFKRTWFHFAVARLGLVRRDSQLRLLNDASLWCIPAIPPEIDLLNLQLHCLATANPAPSRFIFLQTRRCDFKAVLRCAQMNVHVIERLFWSQLDVEAHQ